MKTNVLVLPATAVELRSAVVIPALHALPEKMDSPEAHVAMGAIAKQESELRTRVQDGNGPAHGLWQFEEGGGVVGVLTHPSSSAYAKTFCSLRSVVPDRHAVWLELAQDDLLAAAFARLLLYTSPMPLPRLGDVEGAWSYYLGLWRPGKPRRKDWDESYGDAYQAVTGKLP